VDPPPPHHHQGGWPTLMTNRTKSQQYGSLEAYAPPEASGATHSAGGCAYATAAGSATRGSAQRFPTRVNSPWPIAYCDPKRWFWGSQEELGSDHEDYEDHRTLTAHTGPKERPAPTRTHT